MAVAGFIVTKRSPSLSLALSVSLWTSRFRLGFRPVWRVKPVLGRSCWPCEAESSCCGWFSGIQAGFEGSPGPTKNRTIILQAQYRFCGRHASPTTSLLIYRTVQHIPCLGTFVLGSVAPRIFFYADDKLCTLRQGTYLPYFR